MIFFIINNSGNVGKSNLSRGLYQFMGDEKVVIELETHNSSSIEFKSLNVVKFDGSQIRNMFSSMMLYDNVVIDCGSSVVDTFFNEIQKSPEVLDMIDYFVVPTVSDRKQTNDTLKTLSMLIAQGITTEKIKVVFNKLNKNIDEFSTIMKVMQKLEIKVDEKLQIKKYAVLENLEEMQCLSGDVLDDDMDYRKITREKAKAGDIKGSKQASDKWYTQLLAKSYHSELKEVFTILQES